MMRPCYLCKEKTLDFGTDFYNCCYRCCELIYIDAGFKDSLHQLSPSGMGVEKSNVMWKKHIDNVINGILIANGATRKKPKYTDQCPCGLLPSQCDYHK